MDSRLCFLMWTLICVHMTRSTILDGYVGCNFVFHMAALKNDTASYVLQVFPTGAPSFHVLLNPATRSFLCSVVHPANSTCPQSLSSTSLWRALMRMRAHTRSLSNADTFYYSFNDTRNTRPGLPEGSIWYNIEATDATQVFTFSWTPEEGQEGKWQVCFATQVCVRVCICV
jgi:hypothetical protein